MRYFAAALCLCLFAVPGDALAQYSTDPGCRKGFFWPFVREPGDCATEAERDARAAQGGFAPDSLAPVSGEQASPDPVSTGMPSGAPPPPAQGQVREITEADCDRSFFWPFGAGSDPCATAAGEETQEAASPATPAPETQIPETPAPATPAAETAAAENSAETNPAPAGYSIEPECNKGTFWPFIREPGDCATDTERERIAAETAPPPAPPPVVAAEPAPPAVAAAAPPPVAAAEPAPPPAAAPVPPPVAPPAGPPETPPEMPVTAAAPAPARQECRTSFFWPFVRQTGDCDTEDEDASLAEEGTAAAPPPAAAPDALAPDGPVIAPPAAPAPAADVAQTPPAQPSAETPIAAEPPAAEPRPPVPPPPAAAIAATPTPATPAPAGIAAPAPGVAPLQYSTLPGCRKGTLWPFAREPGDCATDAEKESLAQSGFSPTPGIAPPLANPVGSTAIAAGRGLLEDSFPGAAAAPAAPAGVVPANAVIADPNCTKGVLWPYIRNAGDCPVDGQPADIAVVAPPAPQAPPLAAPPAAVAAAAEENCSAGFFWPFVRAGNCQAEPEPAPGPEAAPADEDGEPGG